MPTTSVQLPDLLSVGRPYELRTNRHCRTITSASEAYFHALPSSILSDAEKERLEQMKIGLWASVCFPTCDPPQLRLATDFLTALMICNARFADARITTMQECGWRDSHSEVFLDEKDSGFSCLAQHDLFRPLMPQLTRAMPSDSSRSRFCVSAEAYHTYQEHILAHRRANTLPSLSAYLDLRRGFSGVLMVLDLLEMVEGLHISPNLNEMKLAVANIIALSMDIFAYNNDQFIGNAFNIVSILRAHEGVSVQGAINRAYALIELASRNFVAEEERYTKRHASPSSSPTAWVWNPLGGKGDGVAARDINKEKGNEGRARDSQLYMQGLKDCIVGTLNWSYETELFFGSKGDEIRQFGWVFLRDREVGDAAPGTRGDLILPIRIHLLGIVALGAMTPTSRPPSRTFPPNLNFWGQTHFKFNSSPPPPGSAVLLQ
ncbi:isoprenoid synthase domain-containing protein [Favolaschia claudopus]|uniref:Isoprenoid synthase domain-containing protein n=1 Tax=Favolaschia claudopus TaxID=2862362 RepID=A0AAW0DY94_9AGAR